MMATDQHDESGPPAGLTVQEGHHRMDSRSLSDAQAQALLRLIEAAPAIQRRAQFFMWMQSHLQVLLPHVLAVCGFYDRRIQRVGFDVFNSSVMPRSLIEALTGNQSPLMNHLVRLWIEGQGRPLVVELGPGSIQARSAEWAELGKAGLTRIAVHGVARPSRAHEIESFFVFGDHVQAPAKASDLPHHFELLMPHLHTAYGRTQTLERELADSDRGAPIKVAEGLQGLLSKREREIIEWVREGKTNQQIGEVLNISALTVKNHVQSILRKLGASNRAQAVATAIHGQLIRGDAGRGFQAGASGPRGASTRKRPPE
jgi:transcriptional regulator EpsA